MYNLCNDIMYNVDDETRVHLSLVPGEEGSDFINANYIEVRVER